MATSIQNLIDFLAPYSGEVKDLPPDQYIPYMQLLTDALIDTVTLEHSVAGLHQFANGNIADRPTAANATWYVSTDETGGPKLYFSDGATWSNLTDVNATNLPFADVGFPALTKISLALSYVLGAMRNSGNYLLGSKVITELTAPGVLAPEGVLNDQLATIDTKLSSFDPTKITVSWGSTSKHVQQMATDVKAILDNIANTAGASSLGFDPSAGTFRHIQATDTNIWAAIKRLDGKMYHEGFDTNTSSLYHAPQGSKYFGDATSMALDAVMNMIENALTRMPIAHAIGGSWINTLTGSAVGWADRELIGIFQFPELASTGGLGAVGVNNVYVDHFAARVLDEDSINDDIYVEFFDDDDVSGGGGTGDAVVTITTGNNEGYDRTSEIVWSNDLDFFTVYAWIDGSTWTTGDPTNFVWSARMVIHRNVGDLLG